MPVPYLKEFKRHGGSPVDGVFVAAGRAEPAVAAERDKFKLAAVGAGIHCAAIGRVATVDHFVNVFDDG